jgi:hypothetical protein
MATDGTDDPEETTNDRKRHAPEHANAKHERTGQPSVADEAPEEVDSPAEAADTVPAEVSQEHATPTAAPHKRAWAWLLANKKVSIPAGVVLLLALLLAVPFTRYVLAGTVLRQNYSVLVVDSQTHKAVTSATVALEGKTAATNNKGVATIHANVGNATMLVTKKYYKDSKTSVLVPIGKQKTTTRITLQATGRQVQVFARNVISGQPLANVTIKALSTDAKTDAKGEVTLVLPAGKDVVDATLSGSGYNDAKVTVKVTNPSAQDNHFTLTPAGKIYFLSDKSGKLDMVKTNLDGSDRQTVLAGTGKEDKPSTVLLASRDWKYIALLSKRDGGSDAKLFLIDTSNDQVTTMDEGQATFTPAGWSGHRFVYTVSRYKVDNWASKQASVKSYDATTKKITLLDDTTAEGDQYNYVNESYAGVYIFDQEVLFAKEWFGSQYGPWGDKQDTLNSVRSDGSQKKVVQKYPARPGGNYSYINLKPGDLNELYIRYYDGGAQKSHIDAYENGKIAASDLSEDDFNNAQYLTYIVSPTGKHTFWTDFRDGKNLFFVGDDAGKNGKQFNGSSEDYSAYGWYTDDYVLVTRKNSELQIMPASGLPKGVEGAFKISDYYKPNYSIRGYGYGYGG